MKGRIGEFLCVLGDAAAPYVFEFLYPLEALVINPVRIVNEAAGIRQGDGFRAEIDSYSAFFENDRATPTGLQGYLESRGVDTLTLVGLATDFCVNYSAGKESPR